MKLEGLNIEELVQSLNDAPAEKSAKIVEEYSNSSKRKSKRNCRKVSREFAEVQANKENFAKYGCVL